MPKATWFSALQQDQLGWTYYHTSATFSVAKLHHYGSYIYQGYNKGFKGKIWKQEVRTDKHNSGLSCWCESCSHTHMYLYEMSLTYIRLASGFSISGSSYSLIEQQTITIRAPAEVTLCCIDMIIYITTNTAASLSAALGTQGHYCKIFWFTNYTCFRYDDDDMLA